MRWLCRLLFGRKRLRFPYGIPAVPTPLEVLPEATQDDTEPLWDWEYIQLYANGREHG